MSPQSSASDKLQEWFQGGIALTAVLGGIAITILSMVTHAASIGVPDWLSLLIVAVVAFYYQRTSVTQTVAALTNGPLHTIADLAQPQRQVRASDISTTAATGGPTQ